MRPPSRFSVHRAVGATPLYKAAAAINQARQPIRGSSALCNVLAVALVSPTSHQYLVKSADFRDRWEREVAASEGSSTSASTASSSSRHSGDPLALGAALFFAACCDDSRRFVPPAETIAPLTALLCGFGLGNSALHRVNLVLAEMLPPTFLDALLPVNKVDSLSKSRIPCTPPDMTTMTNSNANCSTFPRCWARSLVEAISRTGVMRLSGIGTAYGASLCLLALCDTDAQVDAWLGAFAGAAGWNSHRISHENTLTDAPQCSPVPPPSLQLSPPALAPLQLFQCLASAARNRVAQVPKLFDTEEEGYHWERLYPLTVAHCGDICELEELIFHPSVVKRMVGHSPHLDAGVGQGLHVVVGQLALTLLSATPSEGVRGEERRVNEAARLVARFHSSGQDTPTRRLPLSVYRAVLQTKMEAEMRDYYHRWCCVPQQREQPKDDDDSSPFARSAGNIDAAVRRGGAQQRTQRRWGLLEPLHVLPPELLVDMYVSFGSALAEDAQHASRFSLAAKASGIPMVSDPFSTGWLLHMVCEEWASKSQTRNAGVQHHVMGGVGYSLVAHVEGTHQLREFSIAVARTQRRQRLLLSVLQSANLDAIVAAGVPNGVPLEVLMVAKPDDERKARVFAVVSGIHAALVTTLRGKVCAQQPGKCNAEAELVAAAVSALLGLLSRWSAKTSSNDGRRRSSSTRPRWRKKLSDDAPLRTHKMEVLRGELPQSQLADILHMLVQYGHLEHGLRLVFCLLRVQLLDIRYYSLRLLTSLRVVAPLYLSDTSGADGATGGSDREALAELRAACTQRQCVFGDDTEGDAHRDKPAANTATRNDQLHHAVRDEPHTYPALAEFEHQFCMTSFGVPMHWSKNKKTRLGPFSAWRSVGTATTAV